MPNDLIDGKDETGQIHVWESQTAVVDHGLYSSSALSMNPQ